MLRGGMGIVWSASFSALQRAEIAEIGVVYLEGDDEVIVSVLFNEPKLLKCNYDFAWHYVPDYVSVLFNEPKLLK